MLYRNCKIYKEKFRQHRGYGNICWNKSVTSKTKQAQSPESRKEFVKKMRNEIREQCEKQDIQQIRSSILMYTSENNWAEYQRQRTLMRKLSTKKYGLYLI